MKMMIRLFVAFCVATVLSQGIILAMAAANGNLKGETITKGIALLNGVDISGDKLEKMLNDYRNVPVPTHDEVREQRAEQDLNLQMRERSIERMQKDVTEKLTSLEATKAAFDQQLKEFYTKLDEEKENLLAESLQSVKRTLESLAPEQAKDQLLKLYEGGQNNEVVAILKAMPTDKSKKIMGEFGTEPPDSETLYEIMKMMLEGEPRASMLNDARNMAAE